MKILFEIIKSEVEKAGVLPFARFMELALYYPDLGYYERRKIPGRRGDFYTSVSVGELFGQLLAFQFSEWLEQFKINSTLNIVEAGAHDGHLAADILIWLQIHRPKLFEQIEYRIIEPSLRRQQWQKETLKDFSKKVLWFSDFEKLRIETRNSKRTGIIFSNELLDAMPVQRFGWDAKNKNWFEWGVVIDGGKFIWARMTKPIYDSRFTIHAPQELLSVLPDGYTIEISPAAENWWCDAANILERGKLLTMDYGLIADELFLPNRTSGTIRAYFRHHAIDDLLANVGEQDLTAHVNFSAIQKVGEDVGLKTESFSTQTQFLTHILAQTQRKKSFGKWNTSLTRQFQTLTHPEHLGRAFRVLVQSRCNS